MIAEEFWKRMTQQDYQSLTDLFTEDAIIEWPNTSEVFTVAQFIKANAAYPGAWKERILHLTKIADRVITETLVEDDQVSFTAISFFQIKEGKITHLKEYWSDNGEPPTWRKSLMKEML